MCVSADGVLCPLDLIEVQLRAHLHMLRTFPGGRARFLEHPVGPAFPGHCRVTLHCKQSSLLGLRPSSLIPPKAEPWEEDLCLSKTSSKVLHQCPSSSHLRPPPLALNHHKQNNSGSSASQKPVTFYVLKSHLSLKISRCFSLQR